MSDQEVPPEDLPSGAEVPQSDLPDQPVSGSEVPPTDLPEEALQSQFSTPSQKALTVLEGLGRGVSAGTSDALDVGMRSAASNLGVSPENLHVVAPDPNDISARKLANPNLAAASEFVGNLGLLGKLPQVGSKAVDGMLKMGLISGGDELSKAMLGQGDPATAVASHIAENGVLGLFGGALFGKMENLGKAGLSSLENSKLGSKLSSFITGMGHAAYFPGGETVDLSNSALSPIEQQGLDSGAFKAGQKVFNTYAVKVPKIAAKIGFSLAGKDLTGGLGGAAMGYLLDTILEKKAASASTKYVGPALMKLAASGTTEGAADLIDHATTCGKGFSQINTAINNLFNASAKTAHDYVIKESDKNKVNDFIQDGGVDDQVRSETQQQGIPAKGFADGGMVDSDNNPIAKVYPEQNVLLNAAKARVSGYLNSVRPVKNISGLPFDKKHEDPQKQREYDKTLDMAINPLGILNKVKDGSLLPSHMKSFTSMYPELHSELSKQMTKKITEIQADEGKRPPYHMRQAMSLFLGASLDSTLTPQNMMSAQGVFQLQKSQQPAPSAAKTSGLSKIGKTAQTPGQARDENLTKS